MKRIIFLIATVLAFPASAKELDKSFGRWSVYHTGGKYKTCYIVSAPVAEKGDFKKRGQAYLLVFGKGKGDEINASSGYPYKSGGAKLLAGKKTFYMLTKDGLAWAKDPASDRKIVDYLKKGGKVIVEGASAKSTSSSDTYSAEGFTFAYSRMRELCGK